MALVTNVIKGSDVQRVLLLVHGYGADERDLGGLLPYLDPEGRFVTVLPAGPLGRAARVLLVRRWRSDPSAARASPPRSTRSTTCSTTRAREHGFPRSEAVVGGFSQGGGARARARRSRRASGRTRRACSR